MVSDAELNQRAKTELRRSRADTTEGVAVRIVDWANRVVEVNVGGLTQFMAWDGAPPYPDARVRVIRAGDSATCRLIAGASFGEVQAISGDYVEVLGVDDVTYLWAYLGNHGWTPSAGQKVALDHDRQLVVGQTSTDPLLDPKPLPPPPPTAGKRVAWFHPVWSGNWSPGFGGSQVTISTNRAGAYGYGRQIANTIPDSATIIAAGLQLSQIWDEVPGVAGSMGLHGFDGMPGSFGNGNIFGAVGVPGGSGMFNIPLAFANSLKDGAAFGVGFRSGDDGWREYAATPASGRIYMEWSQ